MPSEEANAAVTRHAPEKRAGSTRVVEEKVAEGVRNVSFGWSACSAGTQALKTRLIAKARCHFPTIRPSRPKIWLAGVYYPGACRFRLS